MDDKMIEFITRKSNARFVKGKDVRTKPKMEPADLRVKMFSEIKKIVDDDLKIAVIDLLSSTWVDFISAPSSTGFHHAYPQGNAEHTLEVVHVSQNLRDAYEREVGKKIDNDLLIAGSVLHDIGKTRCYDVKEDCIERTDIGNEQAHVVHGIKLVSQYIKTRHLDDIIHIIASHNNLREWGSPVFPRTVEAWIVHLADMLSAKTMG